MMPSSACSCPGHNSHSSHHSRAESPKEIRVLSEMSAMESFSVTEEHEDEVVDFLSKNFFPNAALNRGLGTADLADHPHHDLCRRIVASGASIGLRDGQNGVLVGVILNEILERGAVQDMFDQDKENDPNIRKLNFIMSQLMDSYDLFSDPYDERVMDLVILCTDPLVARRGIATQLVNLSEKKAAELNCQMVTAQATSCYSQKIFKKLGYTVQSSLEYKDFLLDGQPVLDVSKMEPHTSAQVVTKYI